MKRIGKTFGLVFGTLFLTWVFSISFAGVINPSGIIYTNYLGTPVVVGNSNAQVLVAVTSPTGNEWDQFAMNRITLGVDMEYKQYFGSNSNVKVKLNVKRWNANMNAIADTTVYLAIRYRPTMDTNYQQLQRIQFRNAYKMEVRIDSIYVNGTSTTTFPANLYVKADVWVDRYSNFTSLNSGISMLTPNFVDSDCDGKKDKAVLQWATTPGAVEYQLEWLHVNDYGYDPSHPNDPNYKQKDSMSVAYNFKYNSTRITTTNTSYELNLLFNKGWIIYRVRAMGYTGTTLSSEVFNVWNLNESGVVGSTSSAYKIHLNESAAHENTMNWQYAATYAEEGKRKEVISYFDGSLRNRQTVTKINSNDNTIVGETIYDHQGRPAVQVLPVPVPDGTCSNGFQSTIHFYPSFNKVDASTAYSRINFDKDVSTCAIQASPMSTNSGAANYYSTANSDKANEQGYVPDANGFPFTQVEYTPDNTGRIRRQSGVGPDFKLGSGHETSYLYGKPNQIELDRLFGSEVGYAEHYKKNSVTDANGQVSISYLDQEGRVIATALAGDAPSNTSSLTSASSASASITANAFGNGNTENRLNLSNDGYIFSQVINVDYASNYTFDYNFTVSPLNDVCLPNYCIDCVYDLTIEFIDECGVNLAPTGLQHKMTGKFSQNESSYTFHGICADPQNGSSNTSPFTINNVSKGSYYLNKYLTINHDARQAYIDLYLDTTKNTCIKTLHDFQEEALSNIDSSLCHVDCETCLEQLGSLDDFVSSGKGTANDYYERKEQCDKACQDDYVSPCEASYQMLLADMNPGGQYGEYLNASTGLIDFSTYPLSIYNSSNLLPSTSASWKNPLFEQSTGNITFYMDDNGDSSRIYLTHNAQGAWSPQPATGVTLRYDATRASYYIYPHQLNSVSDFIDNFETSWAKSLVYYHPEYCYYKTCLGFSTPNNVTDGFTSESFDHLLSTTNSFQEAITNGFITDNYRFIFNSSLTGNPNAYPLENWLAPTSNNAQDTTHAWDPFIYFGSSNPSPCNTFGQALTDKFNNFTTINGQNYSMMQIAAMTARCGTNTTGTYSSSCFNFAGTYNGSYNIDILNKEWLTLKSMYLGAKRELQLQFEECKATNSCSLPCGCIGNEDFNAFANGSFSANNYLAVRQPCGQNLIGQYQNKQKRFVSATTLAQMPSPNEVRFNLYTQTGQCPVAFSLEQLLTNLADSGVFANATLLNLNNFNELTNLYLAHNNYDIPLAVPQMYQSSTVSTNGDTLRLYWISPSLTTTYHRFKFVKSSTYNWSDIYQLTNIHTLTDSTFSISAKIHTSAGVYDEITLSGKATGLNLLSCSFQNECEANQLAKDVLFLLNVMNEYGTLTSTSAVSIHPYDTGSQNIDLQSLWIKNAANVGSSLSFRQVSTGKYQVYNTAGNANDGLFIQINSISPSGITSSFDYFSDINSTGQNTFEMTIHYTNGQTATAQGSFIRKITGQNNVGLPAGTCGLPTPIFCQTKENQNIKDLLAVLQDVFANQRAGGNLNFDLFQSINLTPNLISQFKTGLTSTSSSYNATQDILTLVADSCRMQMTVNGTYSIADVVELIDIAPAGEPDGEFDFYAFKINVKVNVGGTIYNGVLKGNTCLPLRGCNYCSESKATEATAINNTEPDCSDSYDAYTACLSSFDTWATAHSYAYKPGTAISYSSFLGMNVCNCITEYCSRLQAVKDGVVSFSSQTAFDDYLSPSHICQKPCLPDVADTLQIPHIDSTEFTATDNCMELLVNEALYTAQQEYNAYIDSLKGELNSRYIAKCLSVNEQFHYTYTDKLYHFTLYYYDQAGNLIKTIPPAGVELVNITSDADALAVQISNDRKNHTKYVNTSHRMATTYEYNSLNQLVAQTTPDADPMQEFEIGLTDGLPFKLTTNKIQMLDENKGYLAGELNGRGYLFRTSDGGATWNRVNNLIGSDFKKIKMITNLIGFAVGTGGTVMKTVDGGQTWDLINLFSGGGSVSLQDINDFDFYSTGGSTYVVTLVGSNGFVSKSTDLTTFTLTTVGISQGDNLISIHNDGTKQVILGTNGLKSTLYNKAISGTNWNAYNYYRGLEIFTLDSLDRNYIIAGAADGRIYKNNWSNATNYWTLVPNNLINDITELQFFNANQGFAISGGKLYKTEDAGTTWTLFSNETYVDLNKSKDCSIIGALGQNGLVRILFPNTTSPTTAHLVPFSLSTAVNTIWLDRTGSGSSSKWLLVLSNGSNLYYTWNAMLQNPVFSSYSTGLSAQITDINFNIVNTNALDGVSLMDNGKLYRTKLSTTSTVFDVITLSNSNVFKRIVKVSNTNLFAGSTSLSKLYRFALNTSDNQVTETLLYNGVTSTSKGFLAKMDTIKTAGTIVYHFAKNSSGTFVRSDQSTWFYFKGLRNVRYDAVNGRWLTLGEDGLTAIFGASAWEQKAHASNANMNAQEVTSSGTYAVGDAGYFSKLNYNAGTGVYTDTKMQTFLGNPIEGSISQNLYDIEANGAKMYVVGQNGRVLYSPVFALGKFATLTHGSNHLYGITAIPSSNFMLSVGAGTTLLSQLNNSYVPNRELFVPPLADLHFLSVNDGAVCGGTFFMARQTNDGGQTWKPILAQNSSHAVPLVPTKVWMTTTNQVVIMGSGAGPMRSTNLNAVRYSSSGLPTNVTAVDRWGNYLVINNQSGTQTQIRTLSVINDSVATLFTINNIITNALKVDNNHFIAIAGNAGFFRYIKWSGVPNASSTSVLFTSTASLLGSKNIRAIAAVNNTEFIVVGENGAFYHSKNPTFNGNNELTSLGWFAQNGTYSNSVDPYDVSSASDITIKTIALRSATRGLYGGTYNAGYSHYSAPNYCFARTFYDSPLRYTARFYYDKLGRLVVSQNARQYNNTSGEGRKFSYTLYDALGRVYEAGEKTENATAGNRFGNVYGSYVSGYYNTSTIDDSKLQTWITGTGARKEVTKSYYDSTFFTGISGLIPTRATQRKRIIHITYEEVYDGNDQTYDHATHYDYDIHGNVRTLIQDNKKMATNFTALAGQRFKRMDYRYDLVSGNVHRMSLQNGQADQWHHAYLYDADNRITAAYTNTQTPVMPLSRFSASLQNELAYNADWEQDAQYYYYDHGPLARTEIGQNNLQGYDYLYNLQGWMKGINSITAVNDPGQDGIFTYPIMHLNSRFGTDVAAFSLQYFNNDYAAINATTPMASVNSSSSPASNSSELFNGNIRYMQTRLTNPTTGAAMPMLNAYQYDQLNRLIASRSYESGLSSNVWNPTSYGNEYYNAFSYDAMGNILTQVRHKRDGTKIEDMKYKYQYSDPTTKTKLQRNRLYHIYEPATLTSLDATDIDNMGSYDSTATNINVTNNYVYDEEGRLIKDKAEKIDKIVWRVDGKVKEIQRGSDTSKRWIRFDYDAMGHRIAKHVYNYNGTVLKKSTYYILDAQGNQISTYDHEVVGETVQFNLKERNMYGSNRLGSKQDSLNMLTATVNPYKYTRTLGWKYYEFSNHLGNVLTVYSDLKTALDANSNGEVDGYKVQIIDIADYSPFGVQLDGRTVSLDSYKYGFQNQEKDDEIKGIGNSLNFEYRMHDPRVGRFFAIDPLARQYPFWTPYAFSGNQVVHMVELEGLEPKDPPDGKLYIYHVWRDENNKRNAKLIEVKTVKGLKSDLIKDVYLDENTGQCTLIDYYVRKSDGTKGASMEGVEPNNIPSVKELNSYFGDNLTKDETPKEEKEESHWYDPGYFEGHYDGFNSGGRLSGEYGWEHGGKQMTFGMVGVLTAPFTITEGGLMGIIGYAGLANSTDDVVGSVTNDDGKSLSQQLTTGTSLEGVTNKTKIGITVITAGAGCYSGSKSIITNTIDANFIPSAVGTANDANSLHNSYKNQKK